GEVLDDVLGGEHVERAGHPVLLVPAVLLLVALRARLVADEGHVLGDVAEREFLTPALPARLAGPEPEGCRERQGRQEATEGQEGAHHAGRGGENGRWGS